MTTEQGRPPDQQGELHAYANGMAEVFKEPGASFSLGELQRRMAGDLTAQDSASVYVQTMNEGTGQRSGFFLDASHMVAGDKPWLVANLDKFPVDDPSHDVTIGQAWESPFGTTDPVHRIALPYSQGYTADQEGLVNHSDKNPVSPTVVGRQKIDEALGI